MKKKYNLLLLVSSLLLFSLQSFVLEPVYISVTSDVVIGESVLPAVVKIAVNAIRIITYSLCYAVIIYSACRFTAGKIKIQFLLFGLSIAYYYAANSLVSYITDPEFNFVELYYVLVSMALEVLMHTFILGVSLASAEKNHISVENTMPFEKLLSLSNPLQRIAFYCGGTISICLVLSRLLYDLQVGAPESNSEIIQMAVYYFSDIFAGFVTYLIMIYVFMTLYLREKNKKADR